MLMMSKEALRTIRDTSFMRIDAISQNNAPPLNRYIFNGSTSIAVIKAPPTVRKVPNHLIILVIFNNAQLCYKYYVAFKHKVQF